MLDVAVVSQDPRLGGGVKSQLGAFIDASEALGRRPKLVYLARFGADGNGLPSTLPRLDFVNQLVGSRRVAAAARDARSVWAVVTAAPYAYGATHSGRPYACWVGTGIASEWAGRRRGLRWSRRLALRVNEPVLLRLEREVLQRARVVYATSAYARATLADAARREIRLLPIPVDTEHFAPLPDDEWSAGLDKPLVVFVGRSDDPRKNVDLLLEAWPRIRAALPPARLHLIGRPPRRPLPPGATALGEVDDVAPVLREAALFVLPSRQEGFGIAIAESLAAGVPALVTPCGGPEELLRGSGGGVVLDAFDPRALAEAAVDLLRTPELLRRMRADGTAYVRREHSPGRFRELVARAYEELDA